MNTATAAALAAQPKVVSCFKCSGSGRYLHFGPCFQCGATGRLTVAKAAARFMTLARALETLRLIYSYSRSDVLGRADHLNINEDGASAYMYGVEAMQALYFHGDLATARKVFEAFSALSGHGDHFAQHIACHSCHLGQWATYSGAAQRLALELAGKTAPTTYNKRGWAVDATNFGFND